MFKKKIVFATLSSLVLLALLAAPVLAAPGDTTLASANTGGSVGNASSAFPAISADGRYVAFQSGASDLVAGDANGMTDIFVRDRGTNTTALVSVSTGGTQGNGGSNQPAISSTGRYVVFTSSATNLSSVTDNNIAGDIFVRDLVTGTTTLVSVAPDGTTIGNSGSNDASITSDGRYVAFESSASNLVAGDTNGMTDIFVRDLVSGTTRRVSVDTGGNDANNISFSAAISADGRYVAFQSIATDLVSGDVNGMPDIFVRDLVANTTTLVSVDSNEVQTGSGSYGAAISSDGRYVAFASLASNLVAGDTNGVIDIFVRDLVAGTTRRVSVASGGVEANEWSDYPAISPDGRYVAFPSWADNLVPNDTNGAWDVFVHDMTTGLTVRASVNSSGVEGDNQTTRTDISSNGSYVAFHSQATNMVAGDTNGVTDVFVREPILNVPTVVFGTGSIPPSNDANLTTGPSQLVVQFSENVRSGGVDGSAEYGGNYLLLWAGPNGTVDTPLTSTAICDSDHVGIAGDDEWIRFDSLAYNATNFTVTATIESAYAPLANGTYRLYLCGQASIQNLAGNPLNGGSNTGINFTVGPAPAPAGGGAAIPATGFAPGRVTRLGTQAVPYAGLGDLWLEIPRLGVQMPIVGVPQANGDWDVSWLGTNAGWLEGSAFPTWEGNSVLTGHVWNADNSAGPFRYLNTLWWGDRVVVHAFGQEYVYEVRSVRQVAPTDVSAMMKHEDLPWLTLVTCRGYNEATDSYRWRVLVRAVLVEIR